MNVSKIDNGSRMDACFQVFGSSILLVEANVYSFAGRLSEDYKGGFWDMYLLENGGFFMAPKADKPFRVVSPNGFEGELSPIAFGVTACLFTYSHVSFGQGRAAGICSDQYHLLREYLFELPEVDNILQAID